MVGSAKSSSVHLLCEGILQYTTSSDDVHGHSQ